MDGALQAGIKAEIADRQARVKARTPATAPAIPTGTGLARKDPPKELDALDAACRGKFLDVLKKPEVVARFERLLTDAEPTVALRAWDIAGKHFLVARSAGEGRQTGAINVVFPSIPRPTDVTVVK